MSSYNNPRQAAAVAFRQRVNGVATSSQWHPTENGFLIHQAPSGALWAFDPTSEGLFYTPDPNATSEEQELTLYRITCPADYFQIKDQKGTN